MHKDGEFFKVFCKMALVIVFTFGAFFSESSAADGKKCLIVAAYHDGFIGQKLKVDGALPVLKGHCEVKQFNMDTKRNPDPAFGQRKALEAKALIESWKPDVVIGIEDNASKYLIQPYYRNADLPFVFAGVDWTAEAYGFPYKNVTGIIEVAPIKQLVQQIRRIVPGAKQGTFIRPDRLSAEKNFKRYERVFHTLGVTMKDAVVRNMGEFETVLKAAQAADFVFFTNNAAISGWDDEKAQGIIRKNAKKLLLTQSEWMAPFSMLTITKITSEQGEYAAEVAVKILNGAKPSDFPVIPNRKWDLVINNDLLKAAGIQLPPDLVRKAKKLN